MSIADHVKSSKNLDLIKSFALKKLDVEWPKRKAELQKAIDLCIIDSIDSIIDKYASWASTATNIAEINVHVWRTLRQNVIQAMKGIQVDPEEAHKLTFHERAHVVQEGKSEGLLSEHENELMSQKYLEAWHY
jgi:hypothetical protein